MRREIRVKDQQTVFECDNVLGLGLYRWVAAAAARRGEARAARRAGTARRPPAPAATRLCG